MLVPVILSGGMGSRLWPLSRRLSPKQFLPLTGKQSLMAITAQRAGALPASAPPIVVCNAEHRFMAVEQLSDAGIRSGTFILEPTGRNTAPAVAAAALLAQRTNAETLLLILPADHYIEDEAAFADACERGTAAALEGHIVTFGVVPTGPATGFGYIQGAAVEPSGALVINRFIEKPSRETAENLLDSGNCYWNSGMFLVRADVYLQELDHFAPEILRRVREAIDAARTDDSFVFLDPGAFGACPADSIDYAVMEHTDKGRVVPMDCGWSDVGAWPALKEIFPEDEAGNVLQGDVLAVGTRDSLVVSGSRLVATLGVEGLIVVETADAVLVTDIEHAQGVKGLVNRLQGDGRQETEHHTRVERPWGSFESLHKGDGHQVKRIIVHPGRKLSLQLHHRRQEHWVVVRGEAEVTSGETVKTLLPGETIHIPVGAKHRLANPGTDPLELIEVQIGDYLGEDDIVRLEDDFGRV